MNIHSSQGNGSHHPLFLIYSSSKWSDEILLCISWRREDYPSFLRPSIYTMQTMTTARIHQGESNIYFWPSFHVANRLVSMTSLYRHHHVLLRKLGLWLIIIRCLTVWDHEPRETVHVDKLSSNLLSIIPWTER